MKKDTAPERLRREWVEAPPFEEFTGGRLDEKGKFFPPSVEQERQMNERLSRLGEVLGDAPFPWLLDGGLNISLYGERFIRYHKDLDLTVFRTNVDQLAQRLKAQGLAIAIARQAKGKVLFRLAKKSEFKDTSRISLGIVAVDDNGNIDMASTDPLHNADLHLHDQDEEGNIVIQQSGVTVPREYAAPQPKRLPSGQELRLSHPALVAFHKLHMDRSYDEPDLLRLRPYLKDQDLTWLTSVIQAELDEQTSQARHFLLQLLDKLQPLADQGSATILLALKQEPLIQGRLREPNVREFVAATVALLVEKPTISPDEFIQRLMRFHRDSSLLRKKFDFLKSISS